MKKNHVITKFSLLWVCITFTFSCGDNEEPVMPPPEPGVETLMLSFEPTEIIGLDALSIDAKKNLYVSNFGLFGPNGGPGNQLFKISRKGKKTVFTDGLVAPTGNTVDRRNNVYVRDASKNIFKITPKGEQSVYATSEVGFAGLVFDENGVMYSGEFTSSVIQRITPDGTVSVLVEDPRLNGTNGITYHQPSQMLYAANFSTGNIYKISLDGTIELLAGIDSFIGYIIEMNDTLYITAFEKHQIMKVSLDGDVEVIAGTGEASQKDGPLLEATFNNPNGIVADKENNVLYVSDFGSPRISKIQL